MHQLWQIESMAPVTSNPIYCSQIGDAQAILQCLRRASAEQQDMLLTSSMQQWTVADLILLLEKIMSVL